MQWSGEVRITLTGGRALRHRIEHLRGTPQNPMSRDDVVAKFVKNAIGVLPQARIEPVVEQLLRIEQCEDVRAGLEGVGLVGS